MTTKPIITKREEYFLMRGCAAERWATVDKLIDKRYAEAIKSNGGNKDLLDALLAEIEMAQTQAQEYEAAARNLYNDPETWKAEKS